MIRSSINLQTQRAQSMVAKLGHFERLLSIRVANFESRCVETDSTNLTPGRDHSVSRE
jgi:hypothetical protein